VSQSLACRGTSSAAWSLEMSNLGMIRLCGDYELCLYVSVRVWRCHLGSCGHRPDALPGPSHMRQLRARVLGYI